MQTAIVKTNPALPPLYEVAEDLMCLLDVEALVTPEQEAEFKAELERQLATVAQKVDHVGGFIKMLEYAEMNTRAEMARMRERARTLKRASERLRKYTAAIIQRMGRKLEGEKFTLGIRSCPASLDITDPDKISFPFQDITITIPITAWQLMIGAFEELAEGSENLRLIVQQLHAAFMAGKLSINNARVRAAIEAGDQIPGADLKLDNISLVIR